MTHLKQVKLFNTMIMEILKSADYDEDGELRLVGIGQESCNGLNKGVKSHRSPKLPY